MINKFRRLLIQIGKILPFVICLIVFLAYLETFIALISEKFVIYDNSVLLNTKISFAINRFIEYDWQTLFVIIVISFSVETCRWNKLACAYLGINLLEKSYFTFELEPTWIYIICTINIIIASYLVFKGVKIMLKH